VTVDVDVRKRSTGLKRGQRGDAPRDCRIDTVVEQQQIDDEAMRLLDNTRQELRKKLEVGAIRDEAYINGAHAIVS
jgi:hypothetical protein